jgi:hypothetical protein
LLWGVLLLGLTLLPGCQGRGGNANGDVVIELMRAPAAQVGTGEGEVWLGGQDGTPIDGAQVEVEGNMTHAGMQPTMTEARGLGAGRYAFALPLSMAGDWVLTVRAVLTDGRKASRDFAVPGVEAP